MVSEKISFHPRSSAVQQSPPNEFLPPSIGLRVRHSDEEPSKIIIIAATAYDINKKGEMERGNIPVRALEKR